MTSSFKLLAPQNLACSPFFVSSPMALTVTQLNVMLVIAIQIYCMNYSINPEFQRPELYSYIFIVAILTSKQHVFFNVV